MTNERGFTLAELLVVIALLGLIMAGVVTLQQQGQQAYLMGAARVDAQQNARVALTLMSRELRAACTLSSLSSSAVTITAADSSGTSDCTGTTVAIRYALSGASLYRDQATTVGGLPAVGSGTVLIGGVRTLTLTGYDLVGATTTGVGATGDAKRPSRSPRCFRPQADAAAVDAAFGPADTVRCPSAFCSDEPRHAAPGPERHSGLHDDREAGEIPQMGGRRRYRGRSRARGRTLSARMGYALAARGAHAACPADGDP